MEITFLSDDPKTPACQTLAVGQPLRDFLSLPRTDGMIVHLPAAGFIAVARYTALQRIERRVLQSGRWTAGVMPAGPHATALHLEFSLGGKSCLLLDFAFSVETHRLASGFDFGEEADAKVLTYAAVEATTSIVAAVRQAQLPARLGQALRVDFARQQANAAHYTAAAKDVGAMAAFARHRRLSRETCTAWEEVRDQPFPAPIKRRS